MTEGHPPPPVMVSFSLVTSLRLQEETLKPSLLMTVLGLR